MIQDAGWDGGPASDGKTLFTRPAGPRGQLGGKRSYLSGDSGAVWGERGQRREVVAALARHRQRGSQTDGWVAAVATAAPMPAGHVGLGPGLVDEHQPLGVKPALMRLPPGPAASDVGAILLAGVQSFF